MKWWKIMITIAAIAGLISSCNSPMSVDTPREETPMGKVPVYLSEFTVEQFGKAYTFNADESEMFVNLYTEPNRMWLDLSLESFSNPVDELLRVAVKKINVHLDSIILKNGIFDLKYEEDNNLKLEFYRWEDPKAIETSFQEQSTKTTSLSFKVDKINKLINVHFDIEINDFVWRTEKKYDDSTGGITSFTSPESKTFTVKVHLVLKYI